MASKQFKKNQVVWAKLKGYPWWPSCRFKNQLARLSASARIFRWGIQIKNIFSAQSVCIDGCSCVNKYKQDKSKCKISQVGTTDVVVNFLGENTHATIKLDQVHDFKENYSQYIKNVNERNKKLKQAVDIGLRISEGKSSYEDERKSMERKYQMEEEEEDENQSSSESAAKNSKKGKKGAVTNKLSNEISLTKTVSSASAGGKKTPKKSIKPANKSSKAQPETAESKNGGNDKIVPENAGEPSLAASEKELASINTRSGIGKKQQKLNEKQTRRNSQNLSKNSILHPDLGVEELLDTEPSHMLSNPIHEKEMNSTEQLAQFNKNDNSMEKSSSNHLQQNESEQKELEEEDHQEMNLEKATKKSAASANGSPRNGFAEDKRDLYTNNSNAHNSTSINQNQSSDSNLQTSNGLNNQQKSSQNGQTQAPNKRNKRTSSQKNGIAGNGNGLNIQVSAEQANLNEIIDSPKKKLKTNQIKPYNMNPQDATELQQSLEAIYEIFQSQKGQNIFKLSEIQDLGHLCDAYFGLNIPAIEFFNAKVGKLFLQHLSLVAQNKNSEDFIPEIKQKLEVVVENIRDKVLFDTLGSDIKELIFKKKVQINGNCIIQNEAEDEKSIHSNTQLNKITSHTKLNGDLAPCLEKEVEDPKKLRDQQLRKKICKKINELLKENYGLEKAQAQDLCVQIERKIKSVQVELNHEYKNNVKGLIRLLKAKEISIDKLQKCNVDELIQVIQHENIQAELKSLGVPQFEKNNSLANNSD